jgi:hypothetical protein
LNAVFQAMVGHKRLNATLRAAIPECQGVYHAELLKCSFTGTITEEEAKALCEPAKRAINEQEDVECKEVTFLRFE